MKAVDLVASGVTIGVEPDPRTKALVRQAWRDLLGSEQTKTQLANDLGVAAGAYWHVRWHDNQLIVRRRSALPAGAAYDTISPSSLTLGSPEVICDGECIRADGEPEDPSLNDTLAYLMAKIAKYLNWSRVVLHGSSLFQSRFRRHALHESDFYTWAFETAHALREQRPLNLDWDNIAEELEDVGISQERAFESHLRVLLAHLLKWAYEPGHRSKSWKFSVENSRDDLKEILDRNPGLRQRIPMLFSASYRRARRDAASETTLDEDEFPVTPPWSYDQVVDEAFWPNAASDKHS
jgi:hypothetical protein